MFEIRIPTGEEDSIVQKYVDILIITAVITYSSDLFYHGYYN